MMVRWGGGTMGWQSSEVLKPQLTNGCRNDMAEVAASDDLPGLIDES